MLKTIMTDGIQAWFTTDTQPAHQQTCMFMQNNKAKLDSNLTSCWMHGLLNWVNRWKPAIVASAKYAQVHAMNTMKCMDEHFGYLTPSTK